jgi:hypothetical protein
MPLSGESSTIKEPAPQPLRGANIGVTDIMPRAREGGLPGSSPLAERPPVLRLVLKANEADTCPAGNWRDACEPTERTHAAHLGDEAPALGACVKCDDENPLRSYRVVARFDHTRYLLYTWGRDSSADFDVLMNLAVKMSRRLGRFDDEHRPALALGLLAR